MLVNRPKQKLVVDVVKKTFDIKLQDPIILPATLTRDAYRIERRLSRPIAVRVWQEIGLYRWLKRLLDHHLGHSIRHGGYAEHALSAILLGNGYRLDRRRKVASRCHPVPELIQITFEVLLKVLD
jgi:hypothetical protein